MPLIVPYPFDSVSRKSGPRRPAGKPVPPPRVKLKTALSIPVHRQIGRQLITGRRILHQNMIVEKRLLDQSMGALRAVPELPVPLGGKIEAAVVIGTIDISGSMKGKNMELAKIAAKTWINTLNLDRSQCAVTTFDDYSYVNQDLTNSYDRLKRAVDNIGVSIGGTNY